MNKKIFNFKKREKKMMIASEKNKKKLFFLLIKTFYHKYFDKIFENWRYLFLCVFWNLFLN
jgi:hypothetical protein